MEELKRDENETNIDKTHQEQFHHWFQAHVSSKYEDTLEDC